MRPLTSEPLPVHRVSLQFHTPHGSCTHTLHFGQIDSLDHTLELENLTRFILDWWFQSDAIIFPPGVYQGHDTSIQRTILWIVGLDHNLPIVSHFLDVVIGGLASEDFATDSLAMPLVLDCNRAAKWGHGHLYFGCLQKSLVSSANPNAFNRGLAQGVLDAFNSFPNALRVGFPNANYPPHPYLRWAILHDKPVPPGPWGSPWWDEIQHVRMASTRIGSQRRRMGKRSLYDAEG